MYTNIIFNINNQNKIIMKKRKKPKIKYTTIRLHKSTHDKLNKYKKGNMSFNKLICTILKNRK